SKLSTATDTAFRVIGLAAQWLRGRLFLTHTPCTLCCANLAGQIRNQGCANGSIVHCLRRSRRTMDSRAVGFAVFRSARSLADYASLRRETGTLLMCCSRLSVPGKFFDSTGCDRNQIITIFVSLGCLCGTDNG